MNLFVFLPILLVAISRAKIRPWNIHFFANGTFSPVLKHDAATGAAANTHIRRRGGLSHDDSAGGFEADRPVTNYGPLDLQFTTTFSIEIVLIPLNKENMALKAVFKAVSIKRRGHIYAYFFLNNLYKWVKNIPMRTIPNVQDRGDNITSQR